MSEGKRPGGLTALAVLNFVFGGLGALGLLAIWALIAAANHIDPNASAEMEKASSGLLYVTLLLGTVSVGLLIASGVGYLKQKRTLGRTLGTAYAVISLIGTVIGLVAGGGFGIGTLIGLIYPVLTLILVNTTFKDDLVN